MDEIGIITKVLNSEVKLKRLSEVATVQNGRRVTKSTMEASPGKFTVWHGGEKPMGVYSKSNCEANTTLIANTGSIGYTQWTDEACWCSDACTMIKSKDTDELLDKYIYYYLMDNNYIIQGYKRTAGIPTLDVDRLRNFLIPLPPLPVQAEIVRILDTFTELTAELTAELAARKKQYEFYREKLVSLESGPTKVDKADIQLLTLGEVGPVQMCKRILKADTAVKGDVPFYKIGTFGKEPDAYITQSLYDKYRKEYSFPNKGDVLISASGTIGRTVIYDGKPAYFQDSNIVWVANDESKVLNKYLYHFYALNPWKVTAGGTIPRLYTSDISRTKMPVPPLSVQQEIVAILDQFDTLTNSLTEGIPHEIALRQKQYEFYREKLLTF